MKESHENLVGAEELMKSFSYKDSDENLQDISRPFCEIAHEICDKLDASLERTVALKKLLESKDWAIAAILEKNKGGNYAENTDS